MLQGLWWLASQLQRRGACQASLAEKEIARSARNKTIMCLRVPTAEPVICVANNRFKSVTALLAEAPSAEA